MAMVYTKVQIEKNSTPAEIIGGNDPIFTIDGKLFLLQDGKLLEVTIEADEAVTLDKLAAG